MVIRSRFPKLVHINDFHCFLFMNYFHKLVNKPLCLLTRARESSGKRGLVCMHRRHRWFSREKTSESRNKRRNSILMTYHYPDLGTVSDWMKQNFIPIRSTTQIRVNLEYLRLFFRSHFAWKTPVASRNIYRLFSQTRENPFCVDIA